MHDLILRNGRVFDGFRFLNDTDLAIEDRRIAAVGRGLPGAAAREIDCTGMTVTPGLIDVHTHVFPLCQIGIDPRSAMLPFGITAAVDAGSAGCNTFELAAPMLSGLGIGLKCLLNLSSAGLSSLRSHPENIDPRFFEKEKLRRLINKYPDRIIGLKLRMGRELSAGLGKEPLARAAEIAHSLGAPLCVHVSDPEFPAGELAEYLEAGDIFTHTYQGRSNTILEEKGCVDSRIVAARRRGVLFDVGDARIHFDLEVFRAAAREGFLPDLFGSDMTDGGVFRTGAFALPYVLSKFVSLGLDEETVLHAATAKAAELFGFPGGTLTPGSPADIAVFAVRSDLPNFVDGKNRPFPASFMLCPRMTLREGTVIWRSMEYPDPVL